MRHLYRQVHRPLRRQKILLIICGALVILIGGWLLLDYGKWRTIYQEMAGAIAQKPLINSEISDAENETNSELSELRKQVTILERSAQIDKAAQDELRLDISELEEENLELREELGFYQNIIAGTNESRGLTVQAFRVEASNDKQRYQFELVLTRIVKGGTVASGNILIELQGNGGQTDYDMKELLTDENSKLGFRIKHFKRITGYFTLPDDFIPETVKVVIQPHEEKAKDIEKTYQWSDIKT